jgi:hypothetical protein
MSPGLLDRKGLMGLVCLSVRGYVTPLLQHLENHMSKGNKGNRPERKLEAQEKRTALDIILFIK